MRLVDKEIVLKDDKKIKLRSAEGTDAEKMLIFIRKHFSESYKNMNSTPSRFENMTVEAEAEVLEKTVNEEKSFMVSAIYEDRIVGNLGLYQYKGEFNNHIAGLGMGILKEFHNVGLGSAMMSYALQAARETGLKKIELKARTFNKAGIALYEKSGFKRVGTHQKAAFIDGEYFDEFSYELLF